MLLLYEFTLVHAGVVGRWGDSALVLQSVVYIHTYVVRTYIQYIRT